MEGLKKLEQVQRTIELMQSHRIINPSQSLSNYNPDSDRFLANLVLLLIQPCGQLDLNTKCQLISEHLPKISFSFLEEALILLSRGDSEQVDNAVQFYTEVDKVASPTQCSSKDISMVGFDAMRRANSTLEDFCRSYFMFHEIDVKQPESVFKHLPILQFTESYIYQLDHLNEQILSSPDNSVVHAHAGYDLRDIKLLRDDPFQPLVDVLELHGLFNEKIQEQLKYGEEYWYLERKLCSALTRNMEILIDDVMRASHLKSFDYRVLNLLMYQLRGQKVNDLHMEFLSMSELLVEVSDDLFDYEDDVLKNNFNILRMFVRIYGASAAPTMLAKKISEAEEKYNQLLNTLDPKLSINYQKRCEEATKEGGMLSGPRLGTWRIPPVIENESLYRSQFSCS